MLHIFAAFVWVAALFEIVTAVLEGFRKMAPTAVLDRMIRPMLQLVLVTAVAAPGAVLTLTGAWVAPYLPVLAVALVWAWWVVRRVTQRRDLTDVRTAVDRVRAEAGPLTRREFWGFTTPRWLSSMLQVALQRLDIFLVAVLAGPVEAALYTTATRAIVVGQMLQQAIGQVVQPRFGESLVMGDRQYAQALYTASTSWLVLLTWPIFLSVSILSVPFLQIFGAEYVAAWPVIVVLSLAQMVATSSGTVDIVLTMSGRSGLALANAFAAFVAMVVLDLLLVPSYGALAAACAWAVSILVRTLLPLWQVHKTLGLSPYQRQTWLSMAWTVGATGVLPLLVSAAFGWTLPGQLVGFGVGTVVLAAYVVVRRRQILAWPHSEQVP
jgi:O-antigen/teichoic acid export membrane protein